MATTTEKPLSFIDKLVGNEGLKTEVTVKLSPESYIHIGLAILIPMIIAIVIFRLTYKTI